MTLEQIEKNVETLADLVFEVKYIKEILSVEFEQQGFPKEWYILLESDDEEVLSSLKDKIRNLRN